MSNKVRPVTRETKELTAARAYIQRSGNILLGLEKLRESTEAKSLLKLASQLAGHPAYRAIIWPRPFPKSFGELPSLGMPYVRGFATELAWSAGVLVAHAHRISEFLTLERQFETAMLTSSLDEAELLLNKIEMEFGVSLWITENRINLLQEKGQMRASRDQVRRVVQGENVPSLISYFVSWLSYKSEKAVSEAEVRRLIDKQENAASGVSFILRTIVGICPKVTINLLGKMLSYTSNLPAVDRYRFLIFTLQYLITHEARSPEEEDVGRSAITALKHVISDNHLNILSLSYGIDTASVAVDGDLFHIFDKYSAGEYYEVARAVTQTPAERLSIELVDVGLRASILEGHPLLVLPTEGAPRPMLGGIADDLLKVMTFSENANEATLRLRKRILTHCNSTWANSLALILDRPRSDERVLEPNNAKKLHLLRSELQHPGLGFCLPHAAARARYFKSLLEGVPWSNSAQSLSAVFADDDLDIPGIAPERQLRLMAMAHARHGRWKAATTLLKKIRDGSGDSILRVEATLLLIRCYLEQDRLDDCSNLAAELCVSCEFMGGVLPISELTEKLVKVHDIPMSKSQTRGRLSVAIVYDIYSRYIGSDFAAERADAFKDVLRHANVTRASELTESYLPQDLDQLIYFLRNVCVPDVLDQSLTLPSTRAVEDERAAILVKLSDVITAQERQQPAELKDELREIRTKQVVRETTLRLDQSKIYVNIEGIRRTLDISMRDGWNRYRILELQGTDIADIQGLERLVRAASGDKIRVILLTPEHTERAKLLSRMVSEVVEMFALSKEFGLDSNLSTNIRHGYVLRELRNPLVNSKLITNKGSATGSYQPNSYWLERLETRQDREEVTAILDRFSAQIDELIDRVNRKLLRIRSAQSPDGLFLYQQDDRLIRTVEARCSDIETHDEFMDVVFEVCWALTEANLARVRMVLTGDVLQEFVTDLSNLQQELGQAHYGRKLPGLVNAISLVRPDVRSAVERVASWFTLSGNNEYQDYDLQIAYEAGLQTVKTYYSDVDIVSDLNITDTVLLRGWTLPIFARLFFLLLDNAAQHGAADRKTLALSAEFEVTSEHLMISVSNDLPSSIDLINLKARVEAIIIDYGRDKASELLRQEGGSGYPKIWKLLNFDLRKQHDLTVSLKGESFVVQLLVDAKGLIS